MDEHEITLIDHPEQAAVGVRRIARTDELADVFATLVPRVAGLLEQLGLRPAGPPFARYHDRTGDDLDVEVGFPVDDAVDLPALPATVGNEPGGVSSSPNRCRPCASSRRSTRARTTASGRPVAGWRPGSPRTTSASSACPGSPTRPGRSPTPTPRRGATRVVLAVSGPAVEPSHPRSPAQQPRDPEGS